MNVCIIGAGVAGLYCAIKSKINNENLKIDIISSSNISNSIIAGQRYRTRLTGDKYNKSNIDKLSNLIFKDLINDNNKKDMLDFIIKVNTELIFLKKLENNNNECIYHNEMENWFGPQLGKKKNNNGGNGANLINFLENLAKELDINIIKKTTVVSLDIHNNINHGIWLCNYVKNKININSLIYKQYNYYILSGGSIGGRLFESTNVKIKYSPQELLINQGINLVNYNTHMYHIFGNSQESGKVKTGCKETDNISECKVMLKDNNGHFNIYEKEISNLLKQHKTHDSFEAIALKLMKSGGTSKIIYPNNKEEYTRVSYHYNHISPLTDKNMKIETIENLFSIGDALNLYYLIGNRKRLPGFALSNCLVSASIVSEYICNNKINYKTNHKNNKSFIIALINNTEIFSQELESKIQKINTDNLFKIELEQKKQYGYIWLSQLNDIKKQYPYVIDIGYYKLSYNTALTYIN